MALRGLRGLFLDFLERIDNGRRISISPDQLRDFAQRYTAAWCSQDPASVGAFFSPNGSLRVNNDPPAVGRSAITELARGFMTDLPDMELFMDGLDIHGETAVYRWTLVSAAKRLRISGYEDWTMGPDGLVAESRGHFDSADYQRQLGGGI